MEILRIVRLSFFENKTQNFIDIFQSTKDQICSFDGCLQLDLMNDFHQSNVYYTISKWNSNESLETYRNSALFKETWAKTKLLFNDKPIAYTLISNTIADKNNNK